jgi:hypothetical protein
MVFEIAKDFPVMLRLVEAFRSFFNRSQKCAVKFPVIPVESARAGIQGFGVFALRGSASDHSALIFLGSGNNSGLA